MRRPLVASISISSLAVAVVVLAAAQHAPAQDAATTVAPPPIAGIAVKMGRRVLSELRQAHGAMPRVAASTHVTAADGSEEIFVVYEIGDYDACVAAAPDRRAGREQCRARLGQYGNCTQRHLARVTVAPTPRGRPEGTGGALVIAARMAVPGSCQLDRVIAFERRDVDLDERPELVLDLVTFHTEPEFRSHVPVSRRVRHGWVLRDDLTVQADLALGEWGNLSGEGSMTASAARWSMRDADRDRHPDVIVESFEYDESVGCDQGPDGWFEGSDESSDCSGEVVTRTLRWDAATDTFREG